MDMRTLRYVIKNIIKKEPEEPIAYYITCIYNNDDYRKQINNKDDNFYTNQITIDSNVIKNMNIDEKKIKKVFEFKEIWKNIDNDTKKYIKKTMKIMNVLTSKYILLL
jgi:hypothetical protein